MCTDTKRELVAYFKSNWKKPNLVIHGPHGSYDVTATLAKIEQGFGSKTKCDEKEALRRRANKELLKLRCIKVMISGAENEEEFQNVDLWLMPPEPIDLEPYEYFHKNANPEDLEEAEKEKGIE